MVAAWLQRHIESGAPGEIAGPVEGEHLGVGQPDPIMGTLSCYPTRGIDYDRAHTRIGMCSMIGGELDRSSHVAGIAHSATRHYVVRRSMR
jgi:hypothetical protein